MKKTLMIGLVGGLTVLSGAAAMAQPYGPPPPRPGYDRPPAPAGWGIDRRLDWLQQRVDRGRADGSLDWREARRVQHEIYQIRHRVNWIRARQDGRLYDNQRAEFQDRLDRVSDQVRWLRHNEERRPW
jgi:hypothetical protein